MVPTQSSEKIALIQFRIELIKTTTILVEHLLPLYLLCIPSLLFRIWVSVPIFFSFFLFCAFYVYSTHPVLRYISLFLILWIMLFHLLTLRWISRACSHTQKVESVFVQHKVLWHHTANKKKIRMEGKKILCVGVLKTNFFFVLLHAKC